MNVNERNELAADNARRVRMYSWQPMPQELAEALPPFGWTQQFTLPQSRSSEYVVLRLSLAHHTGLPRLELAFDIRDQYNIGRILWTPDRPL